MSILQVNGLTKKYKELLAIENISFSVESGEVVGFVGPNGSGKTTTIKSIMGLIKPNNGDVLINNISLKNDFEKAISFASAIIENPCFYLNMTAYENLQQECRIYKCDKKYVEELIEITGLKNRINDNVKNYSLGMKQRLGICRALLHKPKLLLLDEPTNGLDIDGVIEFRKLIANLTSEKKTSILISSHILSELDKICDSSIIIRGGKICDNISIKNNNDCQEDIYEIEPNDVELAISILKEKKLKFVIKEKKLYIKSDKEKISQLIKIFYSKDLLIYSFCKTNDNLESIYLNSGEKEQNDKSN